MAYTGYVDQDEISYLDLKADIMETIGKEIMLSFKSEIPEDEKKYILKDAKVGTNAKGGYIDFYLIDSDGSNKEFTITGIKNFEYEVYDRCRKYYVSVSDEILHTPHDEEKVQVRELQRGERTYRFFLYIDKDVL